MTKKRDWLKELYKKGICHPFSCMESVLSSREYEGIEIKDAWILNELIHSEGNIASDFQLSYFDKDDKDHREEMRKLKIIRQYINKMQKAGIEPVFYCNELGL